MKDDNLVAGEAKLLQALLEAGLVVKEIAEDDDDAARADHAREVSHGGGQIGRARRLEVREPVHDMVHLPQAVGARQVLARLLIEEAEGDGVALKEDEVGEAGRERLGVLQLRHLGAAVVHRRAAVDQQVHHHIGVLLILLDVVAVGAAEHLPVEVPRIVAHGVLAVLRELDGEALEGRAVVAHAIALHDRAREQAQRLAARDRDGIEVGSGIEVGHEGSRN